MSSIVASYKTRPRAHHYQTVNHQLFESRCTLHQLSYLLSVSYQMSTSRIDQLSRDQSEGGRVVYHTYVNKISHHENRLVSCSIHSFEVIIFVLGNRS